MWITVYYEGALSMKTYYYLDWYYDQGFSEKLANLLHRDIIDRKSLVFISAEPADNKEKQGVMEEVFEKVWFDQANIFFEEYYLIDHNTQKEEARRLIQRASAIFLCGGYPQYQMQLLTKYDLPDLIKMSHSVVMGTSAGGMNMSKAYVDEGKIYEGMGLNHFSFEAHFDYANIVLVKERFALSEIMDVYVAAEKDGVLRVRGSQIDIIGNVYLISHTDILKLEETM